MPLNVVDLERTLDSHEIRIGKTESSLQQMAIQQAVQSSLVDALIKRMDTLVDILTTHGAGDGKVQIRLHDLEVEQERRIKFGKTISWIIGTIVAAVIGDVILRILPLISIK